MASDELATIKGPHPLFLISPFATFLFQYINPADGFQDASLQSYSNSIGNVTVSRSYDHDYVFVEDSHCGHKVRVT